MLQGTSSSVGKSVLAAALCRIFARRGLKVAPFKSQNMSLNSYITSRGEEMGRAQVVQALAAGTEPAVEMNPVLLKPEGNSRSRVILMGRPWRSLSAGDYHGCREVLWSSVEKSFEKLSAGNDLIIVEGAGSPAEINLKESEIVNMRVARTFGCPVLLVGDIDRGGVFAAIAGTLALLTEEEGALVKGFLINKFRGDLRLLEPGLHMLSDLTEGRPTLGVIPWLDNLAVAREDSADLGDDGPPAKGEIDIAVIKLPGILNFDDFDSLALEEGVSVRFTDDPGRLGRPDAVILPGSRNPEESLAWMRARGFDSLIGALVLSGSSAAGIAGGYRMLGRSLTTPVGKEVAGLGLLPVASRLSADSALTPVSGVTVPSEGFPGPGALPVEGLAEEGAASELLEGGAPLATLSGSGTDGAVSAGGRVWGTALHGVFDHPALRAEWLRFLGLKGKGESLPLKEVRERAFHRLADEVEAALDMKELERIIGL